jgi:hypothetical protein
MSDRYGTAALKERARRRTTGYDSYKGVWDQPIWIKVRVNEHVETVLSVSFKKGDVTLARYGRDIPGTPAGIADTLFAYSFRSGGEMAVHNFDILEK